MRKDEIFNLVFIVLILNLIWEFAHSILYIDLTGIPIITHLILASFWDIIIIIIILVLVSIINNSSNWIRKPKIMDYFLLILFSLIISTIIEIININLKRWTYTEAMPTILGIGLTPLVQLAITGVISLLIFKKFSKKYKNL